VSVSSHSILFSPLLFLCVGVWCVPLFSFSVSFRIYFFCFGVSGMGLYCAREYIDLYGGFGVLRGWFFGFRGPYPMSAVWSLHGVTSHRGI